MTKAKDRPVKAVPQMAPINNALGYAPVLTWVAVPGGPPLGRRDTMYLAEVEDGQLRVIVVRPSPIEGAPLWAMQLDHIPAGVQPFEGMGLVALPDAQQAKRRAPALWELVDAKMQLLPPDILMAVFVQANNLPPYLVSCMQTGKLQVVQPQ